MMLYIKDKSKADGTKVCQVFYRMKSKTKMAIRHKKDEKVFFWNGGLLNKM